MESDLDKLFPPDLVDDLPPEFAKVYSSYVKSLEAVMKYNEYFATGNVAGAKGKSIYKTKD